MCSNESPPLAKDSLSVSVGNSMAGLLPGLEQYRLHLYHYAMAERIRLAQQLHPQSLQQNVNQQIEVSQSNQGLGISNSFTASLPFYPASTNYSRNLSLSMALLHQNQQQIPEEPKPQHSYIGLIAMAILSSPEKKLVLSDIYQHILEHYPYFRRRGPGWRNSIRHNLSLNDCFIKSGRSANGKGHYWAIHPANLDDFRRGDFRRRKAQRKVRRHMGLAVDEEPDSPSPPPLPSSPPPTTTFGSSLAGSSMPTIWNSQQYQQHAHQCQIFNAQTHRHASFQPSKKRQFDVASLLAPDDDIITNHPKSSKFRFSEDDQGHDQEEVEVDVVADSNIPSTNLALKNVNNYNSWRCPISMLTEDHSFTPIHHSPFRHCNSTNINTNSSI